MAPDVHAQRAGRTLSPAGWDAQPVCCISPSVHIAHVSQAGRAAEHVCTAGMVGRGCVGRGGAAWVRPPSMRVGITAIAIPSHIVCSGGGGSSRCALSVCPAWAKRRFSMHDNQRDQSTCQRSAESLLCVPGLANCLGPVRGCRLPGSSFRNAVISAECIPEGLPSRIAGSRPAVLVSPHSTPEV